MLNKKQQVAVRLASIQSAHSGAIPAYFHDHLEAVPLGDEIRDVIRNKRVDITGDPYDVAERAHALVERTRGIFTQPGKLEAGMREIFERLK
jgi:hypothetical protein